MNSYIFVFSGGVAEREKLVEIFNKTTEIYTWRYDMESCFYILSNHSARQIAESIKRQHPSMSRHVITKLGDEYWGELTPDSWYLLERREIPPAPIK